MRVIIACEFSGIVRDAFIAKGHEAVSCDLLPSESFRGRHFRMDIREFSMCNYDLLIAHPPCTHLASSGARHFANKQSLQQQSIEFVKWLWNCPVEKIAIENPVGILSTKWRKPTQIIQPFEYGHPEMKTTCLWLKGLNKLIPTNILPPLFTDKQGIIQSSRKSLVHFASPGVDRWKNRSRFYKGIASAMAEQWGNV